MALRAAALSDSEDSASTLQMGTVTVPGTEGGESYRPETKVKMGTEGGDEMDTEKEETRRLMEYRAWHAAQPDRDAQPAAGLNAALGDAFTYGGKPFPMPYPSEDNAETLKTPTMDTERPGRDAQPEAGLTKDVMEYRAFQAALPDRDPQLAAGLNAALEDAVAYKGTPYPMPHPSEDSAPKNDRSMDEDVADCFASMDATIGELKRTINNSNELSERMQRLQRRMERRITELTTKNATKTMKRAKLPTSPKKMPTSPKSRTKTPTSPMTMSPKKKPTSPKSTTKTTKRAKAPTSPMTMSPEKMPTSPKRTTKTTKRANMTTSPKKMPTSLTMKKPTLTMKRAMKAKPGPWLRSCWS